MQCPKCESEMISRAYEDMGVWSYEGPSEWHCPCGLRLGYFCNQQLGEDEIEPVDCEGCRHHPRYVVL